MLLVLKEAEIEAMRIRKEVIEATEEVIAIKEETLTIKEEDLIIKEEVEAMMEKANSHSLYEEGQEATSITINKTFNKRNMQCFNCDK